MDGVCKIFGLASYVANSEVNYNAGSGTSVVLDGNAQFSRFDSNSTSYAIGSLACASAPSLPIPVSDNHAGRTLNDDGSTTIKTPKFIMNGSNLFVSANSDMNGVCKIYGLMSYVANSEVNYNAGSGTSVVLDNTSHFKRYDSNSENYAVGSLICR